MDMVERVAKAIDPDAFETPKGRNGDDELAEFFDRMRDRRREHALKDARAALEAMREPTDEMSEAAYQSCERDDRWCIEDDQDFAKAWNGALDAALSRA